MPRPARPDDLYRFRVPLDPRLSPDGRQVAFTLKTVAPKRDGYRHGVWVVPADGSGPARQLTLSPRNDRSARFSPDGRTLAFLSDRRSLIEDPKPGKKTPGAEGSGTAAASGRDDAVQVHLLSLDGGEARELTDLPRGVAAFAWSPDGRRLAVLSSSLGATVEADARIRGRARKRPDDSPPASDFRYLDRLGYLANGAGFVDDRQAQLWVVDVATGAARRLTDGPNEVRDPAWSPDGTRIAFSTDRRRGSDIRFRSDAWVVDVETGAQTRVTGGDGIFECAAWTADGGAILTLGHRFAAWAGSRYDVWRFAADGSDAGPTGGTNLTARHDRMFVSAMNSDIVPGEGARLLVVGAWVYTIAPDQGAEEVWRVSVEDGALERLTHGTHYISSFDAVPGPRGGARIAFLRSTPTEPSDIFMADVPAGPARRAEPRRLTSLNAEVLADLRLAQPEERRWSSDQWEIQGWYLPPLTPERPGRGRRKARETSAPLVLEIHGGPHTHYGWAPMWEWQVLAGMGIGVLAANPRGSDGYTEAFNAANRRDWGDGPMRDVLAGVDALVADGRADPARLGVTGGSYGGYLTNWIVAKDQRFAAAVTCRSVTDMTTLMLTGDLMTGDWARLEFGAAPWEDTDYYREISPLTYAPAIRTPLLIQHSEQDIRTTVAQAEALFTTLRSLRRPVRFMRVPAETHELTRSGAPFRRVENLARIGDWFDWYLVQGRRGLPPKPRERAGA